MILVNRSFFYGKNLHTGKIVPNIAVLIQTNRQQMATISKQAAKIMQHIERRGLNKVGRIIQADNGRCKLLSEPIAVGDEVIASVIYTSGRLKGVTTSQFHFNIYM